MSHTNPSLHPVLNPVHLPVTPGAKTLKFPWPNASQRLNLNSFLSEQTITDRSAYGNNATLKSGVYFSTDGLADKGIGADCSAEGSGDYYYTARIRSSSTGTKWATIGGAAVSTFLLTANVWVDAIFDTASSVTPSDCYVGWNGDTPGGTFSDCDWSEVKLWKVGVSDAIAYWPGCDSEAADLDGHFVADVSGNGYHGAHVGCSSGSGEGMDPVLAKLDGGLLWFDGVDDYLSKVTPPEIASKTVKFKFLYTNSNEWQLFQVGNGASYSMSATINSGGTSGVLSVASDNSSDARSGTVYRATGLSPYIVYTVEVTINGSYQLTGGTINGNALTTAGTEVGRNRNSVIEITLGARSDVLFNEPGLFYDLEIDGVEQTGFTLNGSLVTLATKRATILQTAGLNANLWAESLDFENGENIEGTPPKLTDVSLDDRGGSSTTGVNYDAVADADGIGGANSGSYCLKISTTAASLGMGFATPADDVTRTASLYYYVPSGQPDLELRVSNVMDLWPTLLSGNLTTKDAWTGITIKWRVGTGNPGGPWIGPAGGAGTCYFDDITITNPSILVFEDLSNPTYDATGRPLLWMRPNDKVINVLFDSSKATIAADTSMDVTKTVYAWVYYDGTDGTFFDLGTPTVGATSGALTATDFTGILTYYVNGVATTTLGSAGWKLIAITSNAPQGTDAIDLQRTCAALRFSERELSAAEITAIYDAEKSQYGL